MSVASVRMLKTIMMLGMSLIAVSLTSCFSVDSTKKIKLSKEEQRVLQYAPEELYLKDVKGIPLGEWVIGKKFIAADNRAILIFSAESLVDDPENSDLKGKTLTFKGIEERLMPDNTRVAVILFDCEGSVYRYETMMPSDRAANEIMSDALPMLHDPDIIAKAGALLKGKRLWTRTPVWYVNDDDIVNGRKFVPVVVSSVESGDMVFPLKVNFTGDDGASYYFKMNLDGDSNGSRKFSSLFYLEDIRSHYSRIEDAIWSHIQRGEVSVGMTKEECRLSLGNPPESLSGHDYSQTHDIWKYADGTMLVFRDGQLYNLVKNMPE